MRDQRVRHRQLEIEALRDAGVAEPPRPVGFLPLHYSPSVRTPQAFYIFSSSAAAAERFLALE
jgi:hypothetical protein